MATYGGAGATTVLTPILRAVDTAAPMNSLATSHAGLLVAGPSRLVHPSIAPVQQLPEVTPEQRRTRRCLNGSLIAAYVVILVLIGLAIADMVLRPKERHVVAQVTAGIFVAIALPLSLNDISLHFSHYVRPDLQKYYVRILFLVPIYAIESWLALRYKDQKLYLEVAREAYEGYVIYNFFSLLLTFCGGAEHLRRLLLEKAAVTGQSRAHMLFPLCWTRGWRLTTGEFVARCRLGVFQYTFVRTFLAVLTFILAINDAYGEGRWTCAACPYPYFIVILNVSQACAMYCLVLFYHEMAELLAPLRPLNKFIAVKAVVFLSFCACGCGCAARTEPAPRARAQFARTRPGLLLAAARGHARAASTCHACGPARVRPRSCASHPPPPPRFTRNPGSCTRRAIHGHLGAGVYPGHQAHAGLRHAGRGQGAAGLLHLHRVSSAHPTRPACPPARALRVPR